jgi:hypothetical protein
MIPSDCKRLAEARDFMGTFQTVLAFVLDDRLTQPEIKSGRIDGVIHPDRQAKNAANGLNTARNCRILVQR